MFRPTKRRGIAAITALTATSAIAILAGCAPASTETSSGTPDDGTELTMWVRSNNPTEIALVDAYNASHDNQIKVTEIPDDSYQAKIGAAATSHSLPDLLGVDVSLSPNYTQQGLLTDLTARIDALPDAANLVQSHIDAATYDDKQFGVPFQVDPSMILYNRDLFTQAGLDPIRDQLASTTSTNTQRRFARWVVTLTASTGAGTAPAAVRSPCSRT